MKPLKPLEWLAPEAAADEPQFWREWLRLAAPALDATCVMIVRPAAGTQPQRTVLRAGEQTRDVPTELIGAALRSTPLQLASHPLGGGTFALRLPWDDASEAPLVAVGEVRASAWGAEGPDHAW